MFNRWKKLLETNNPRRERTLKNFKSHRLGLFSLWFLLIVVLLAFLAPIVAPHAPNEIVGPYSAAPSKAFWLGTDQIGRDVLSRLIYGARTSLIVAVLVAVISLLMGVTLGLIAGYFGGKIDLIIMSFTDMVMSFPYLLLVMVAAALAGPGLWTTVLVLGFVNWPGITRIVRGNVLAIRETEYVKAAQLIGYRKRHILTKEILPNTTAPILIYATSVVAYSILDEAALSFFALGIQSPTSSLGNMLNGAESLTILTEKLWLWLPSGILIILIVIAVNFLGDALRDTLDPKKQR